MAPRLAKGTNSAADIVEVLQDGFELLARDRLLRIPERQERVFDRVCSVRDIRLLDDARRPLERVGNAQQPLDGRCGPSPFFQIEHALCELVDKVARFRPEVF